jgi:hypothetical protein
MKISRLSVELEADGVRLVAFQRWLASEIGTRLEWPADAARQRRQIGQASAFVQKAVADLAKRGWLFRPAELAKLITDQLDHVRAYQRNGAVSDLYKYLERAWDNWTGRNAEELAQKAREQHVHRAHMARPLPPSMAEITLRNLEAAHREAMTGRALRAAARHARKGACRAVATDLLPGFSP